MKISEYLLTSEKTLEVSRAIEKSLAEGSLRVTRDAASLFVSLILDNRRKILYVVTSDARVDEATAELKSFVNSGIVFDFPEWEALPYEKIKIAHGKQAKRLASLEALTSGNDFIIVVSAKSFLRKFPPLRNYHPVKIEVKTGENFVFDDFAKVLVEFGYEKADMVNTRGTFSVRGGIVDVYPSLSKDPVRIEFFGDTIESIRVFDSDTQLSKKVLKKFEINRETDTPLISEKVKIMQEEWGVELYSKFSKDRECGYSLSAYWQGLFGKLDSLFDYIGDDVTVVFESREEALSEAKRFFLNVEEFFDRMSHPERRIEDYFLALDHLEDSFESYELLDLDGITSPSSVVFESLPKPGFRPSPALLMPYFKRSQRIFVFCSEDIRPEKVRKSIMSFYEETGAHKFKFEEGFLKKGFYWHFTKTLFLPVSYLLGGRIVLSLTAPQRERKLEEMLEVSPGDYVVHARYGIGKLKGIVRELQGEVERELIVIDYADARLKMPVEQLDKLSRYTSPEENIAVDRLGSPEWRKAKEKARKSVRKLAFNLLAVYAKREISRRPQYELSNPWIRDFESTFPYEETEDQIKAINDIYMDMSVDKPMERLVIGDVGFGKTEVAMRAAFVSVVSGRKVIVLSPTTVLAEQHLETWRERFTYYPVRIEMISRFRSLQERKRLIKEFNDGKVDILIGTHTVLSKEISLEEVGLVIIDEEHLFGVSQKEVLKSRKAELDMLFLSATPIPRTLQMALSKIRDISLIETPPLGRLPIVTHIGIYDDQLIKEALQRELDREGQTLYVHNRVKELSFIKNRLKKLLPDARIDIAHGSLRERELESRMVCFWRGDIDILVTTTIVESGLDMPLVNTLIVDNAENLGLAQAYQLRGRIGRSYRQAFAYFLHQNDFISEDAKRRLTALLELSDLGSGFRLALKDLEIRGAGNVLGPEQHGHIFRIGLRLYLDMLKQEVARLEGQKVIERKAEVKIDLPISVYIPEDYAGSLKAKYELYPRIAGITTIEERKRLLVELRDRFGEPPHEVKRLLDIALIRNMASEARISSIRFRKGFLILEGAGINREVKDEIDRFRRAEYSAGKISLKVNLDEVLEFLIDSLTDIIAIFYSRKEKG